MALNQMTDADLDATSTAQPGNPRSRQSIARELGLTDTASLAAIKARRAAHLAAVAPARGTVPHPSDIANAQAWALTHVNGS